ncbi:MAG: hypothetical protein ACI4ML_07890 [Aristaeellaceae bacterium]
MEEQRVPGWLGAAFVAVMLGLAALLAWYAPAQYQLRFQLEDTALSLDTSRQREAKQQYEYGAVVEALPLARTELEETLPLTQAAQAREQALRDQRKALRTQASDLAEQLEEAQAHVDALQAEADALTSDVAALKAQQESLRAQIAALLEEDGSAE